MPDSAADYSSSSARYPPAANVAAGACGITPHAHSDPELGISYFDDSDGSDSEKLLDKSASPAVPRLSRDCRANGLATCVAVGLAVIISIMTHHISHLVHHRTSALTMAQPIVIVKTVVSAKLPRRSVMS